MTRVDQRGAVERIAAPQQDVVSAATNISQPEKCKGIAMEMPTTGMARISEPMSRDLS
ncbi:Uncharacterised protein [Mycobacteroides abscessus subsp. massiliense]|nr:Uncharacterised protein [Mycobacteroides abscessus subsp. massiliense]